MLYVTVVGNLVYLKCSTNKVAISFHEKPILKHALVRFLGDSLARIVYLVTQWIDPSFYALFCQLTDTSACFIT
ncbi:hypothetical protein L596_026622 [Steinernema carpocapsae]|uniref:Uncharacterized protein n=1 Tax=Steinernema carpocapsae TaxID=34508 RepID=A0A4U5M1Y9_STECR|nr:hypothetical protein L596_026622 [Steinernema carpocapsae]